MTKKLSRADKQKLRDDIKTGALSDYQLREKYGVSQRTISGTRRFAKGDPIHSTKNTSTIKSHEKNYSNIRPRDEEESLEDDPEQETPNFSTSPQEYMCGSCSGTFSGRPKSCPHCGDVFIWE